VLVLFWFEAGRARHSSWLEDVRLYRATNDPQPGPGIVPSVVEAVRSLGLAGGRLGIEGGAGSLAPVDHAALVEALRDAGATIEDSWPIVEAVRRVKSAAEIAYIRKAAAMSDAAVEAGLAAVHEGGTDGDVGAAIAETLLRLGSETPCQGPIIAAGWRSGAPHSSLGRQTIRRGDAVFLEVTGEWRRSCAPLMRTAIVGEPTAEQARAAEIGKAALATVIATARPGVLASDVARAAGEVIAPALSDLVFHGNFGYPVGLGFPPTWTESLGFQLRPDNHAPLAAGMTFHLPVSLRRFGEWGICQSQTILITDEGAEPLTKTSSDVRIVA